MAWSAPSASEFSVGQVVTASVMNAKIANNLRYLKGLDGAVTIENDIATTGLAALRNDGNYQMTIERTTATARKYGFAVISPSGNAGAFSIDDVTATATRLLIDIAGNVGIGTTTPAAKLHVSGPAGGGFAFFSANDVTSLQTPIVAGTVVSGCAMWLWDRNNTTGVAVLGFNGQSFSLGSAPTYVNSDTITVTLTAGGAITVQRTTGTNGSHDINMMILYF